MSASRLTGAPLSAVLPASDIRRARDFYTNVLGLDVEDLPTGGAFFVHSGKGTNTLVYETTASHGDATVASFLVDDVVSVVDDLRARGVVFEEYDTPMLKTVHGIAEMGQMRKGAWFKDTEGNTLNIAQM